MTAPITNTRNKKTVCFVGYWSGLSAFAATAGFVLVQVLQLAGIFTFPFDEILIYGTSLCIVVPFMLEMLALHYVTPEEKRFWSHGALIFSIVYCIFVSANYVVQLATVIPMKLRGTVTEIHLLEQTPHSMFWDYDAMGYMFMGLANLLAIPAFRKDGFQKWVRRASLANALVTPLIAIVYFYPTYSNKLLILGFPWGVTAPMFMLLLAIHFKKMSRVKGLGHTTN
jgi:hypothetical protein